jgi:flavin reductase (DIM6/NTAB) family NADH-FMN oxidoreductase RutF
MVKTAWKAGTMLAPVPPALVSCGTMKKPNVMTAAWTGIICSEPVLVYVSLRPTRYSHKLIKESGEFVINVPTVALAKAVDLCGVKSGKDVDKFNLVGLTAAPCSEVKAPQVAEAPVSLECKVKDITSLGTHDMFLAEVVAVNVDDTLIDKNGALNLGKAGLLAYAHGFYYGLGKKIGKFGWSVEKKSTKKKRAAKQRGKVKNG